jgi:hypothetical protein
MHSGTCLCRAVTYEVAGPFEVMVHCHCSMCRKHHGSMFATFVSAPLAALRWTSGESNIDVYQSSGKGRRPFCRSCGSKTPTIMQEERLVILPAGNLEGDPGIRPQMHMFAGSRASWFPITDTLPQYEGYPPQFGGGGGLTRLAPKPKAGVMQGSCLCSETAWEFTGPPERVQNCHCSRCRKARSAAHATNAIFKVDQFTWVRGKDRVRSYRLEGARYFGQDFCGACGSPTPIVVAATGRVFAACGTLDSPLSAGPVDNVFVNDKAPWFEITDGLPQWAAYPPRK